MCIRDSHDCGDVWLPIGKMYSYAEEHIRRTRTKDAYRVHKFIGTGCFVLFIVFFMVPRLFFYGGLVYQASTTNKWYRFCYDDAMVSLTVACVPPNGGYGVTGSLMVAMMLLYPLHVYWGILIVRMAIRVLFASEYDDVRSGDED